MTEQLKPGLGHLDKIYSQFVNKTIPLWHKLNITPNILTTFGLISSLLCVYFIYKRNAILAILFLWLRMYFDYADGMTARRYNQVSKFGDWYDHLVDTIGFSLPLIIVLFFTKNKWWYIIPILFFMILSVIYVGCIEKKYDEKNKDLEESDTLKFAKKLCFSPDLFKWVDNSALYIVITIVIIILCIKEKKT
jgi:phosphatidylglycerophosphate synthase